MGAPVLTANFMKTLANKIRQVSVYELFEGVDDRDRNRGKLALDYIVPITWVIENQDYAMRVVAQVSCYNSETENYVSKILYAEGKFRGAMVRSGPVQWGTYAEQFAYQLVRKLRAQVEKEQRPTLVRLGTNAGLRHNSRRILID